MTINHASRILGKMVDKYMQSTWENNILRFRNIDVYASVKKINMLPTYNVYLSIMNCKIKKHVVYIIFYI